MSDRLHDFLVAVEDRKEDPAWTLSEIYQRISEVRATSVTFNRFIPPFIEELSDEELDDLISAIWILRIRHPIDDRILLELDVLGSMVGFVGCQTRLELRIREGLEGTSGKP